MAKNENKVQKTIMDYLANTNTKIYRNNTGMVYKNGRPIRFGLCNGSSDLIGYTKLNITEDMVGSQIAVFTAIECKHKGNKPSDAQIAFLDEIEASGGICGVAESVECVMDILSQAK